MTQGNCCRLAVGTRPDSVHQGRTRPPPRLPSAPPSWASLHLLPPNTLPLQPAARPFGRTAGGPGGSRADRGGARGLGTRAGRTGRWALQPPPTPPLGRPGTAARLRCELCSFSSNYLSEQRTGESPKKGPPLLRVSPSASEGHS